MPGQGRKVLVHQAPAQLRGRHGVRHRAPHREARAARHIGAEPHREALVEVAPHRRDAAGQLRVALRAVRHVGPRAAQQLDLLVARVDAVRHHGVRPQQPKAVVRLAVAARPRAELAHPRNLGEVLGQVALDRHVELLANPAELLHEAVGHARGKARGKDGACALITANHVVQPAASRGGRRPARLNKGKRRVAVHVDLAHVAHEPRRLEFVHKQPRGRHVNGAKDDRPAGWASPQVVGKNRVGALGVGQVAVAGLLREGIGVQPLDELAVHADPAERVLRGMDVDVAHAGNHEGVAAVDDAQPGVFVGKIRRVPDAGAFAARAHGAGALLAGDLGLRDVPADVSLKDKRIAGHRSILPYLQQALHQPICQPGNRRAAR